MQALRFLRDVLVSNQRLQQSWVQLRPVTAPAAATTFVVDFSVAGIDEKFHYELSLNVNGPDNPPENERLSLGDRCLFHQDNAGKSSAQWVIEPQLAQVPQPGLIALSRIPAISEIVIAFTALNAGIGCYVFSDKVLCERSKEKQQMWGLADDAGNFLDSLRDIVTNLQDLNVRKSIVGALQRLNPSISSVELNDIQNPNSVVVGHRFDGKTLALGLSQESDGFRRFYAHLLAIYQRPPKQTLIFEHPEDGIHPAPFHFWPKNSRRRRKRDAGR